MSTIVFVFDYVMHYHRDTLLAIDAHVRAKGGRFVLLTARHRHGLSGRAPLVESVVHEQRTYELFECKIGGFTVRHQIGLLRTVKALRPDIVVTMCHSGTLSEWQLALRKRRYNFKLFAWQSGFEYNPGRFKDAVLSRFIPLFDHHLCYHTNARLYALRYGAEPHQTTVMHNTINEERIERRVKEDARRVLTEAFPSISNKKILLYVGAVLEEKRLSIVFEALDLLKHPGLVFLVVGDGAYLPTLRSLANGRADVLFAGRVVEGVGPYFDASDVFVLPGTGGLAINEAMAHGLPIVSSYADGSADDLVVHDANGFRLKDSSAAELARYIDILASNPDVCEQMGQESTRMIRTQFSFSSFVERICTAIDR